MRFDDERAMGAMRISMSTRPPTGTSDSDRLTDSANVSPRRLAIADARAGGEPRGAVKHREHDGRRARDETDAFVQGEVRDSIGARSRAKPRESDD